MSDFCVYERGWASHSSLRKKNISLLLLPSAQSYSFQTLDYCDIRPAVLVMDPTSAWYFLQQRKGTSDILLFDEPAADLSPGVCEQHNQLMASLPAISVLMSATLPCAAELKKNLARPGTYMEDMTCEDVTSDRIASPCTVVDSTGSVFAPHRFFKGAVQDFIKTLGQLHVRRLYSPRAALQLFHDLPEAEKLARNVFLGAPAIQACSFDAVRDLCVEALQSLPPDLQLPLVSGASSSPMPLYREPALATLCTTGAALLPGTSIVLSDDEDAFWEVALPPLLQGCERLSKRLAAFDSDNARREKFIHRLSVENTTTEDGKSRARASQKERQQTAAALSSEIPAATLWPEKFCVNTGAHAAAHNASLDPCMWKTVPELPHDILRASAVPLVEGMLRGCLK